VTAKAKVHVHRLVRADVPMMRDLNALFGEVFEDAEAYRKNPPRGAYLDRLLGTPEFVALAALEAGTLVGGLVAYELVKFEQERSEYYIYDLAVREDRRRRGVATALIEALRAIAGGNGPMCCSSRPTRRMLRR
jgi:aminoglycoside 3-N-acetyltransferase I